VASLVPHAAAWYLWTQVALQRFPAAQGYRAPVLTVTLALVAIAVLAALALARRRSAGRPELPERRAPRPWVLGLAAFALGLVWLVLDVTALGVAPSLNPVIPILVALAWGGGTALLVRRWARGSDWRDGHRVALVSGALVASMLEGFLLVGALGGPVAVIGKLVLNVAALTLLVALVRRTRRRPHPAEVPSGQGAPAV